jgi:hypothetical protein
MNNTEMQELIRDLVSLNTRIIGVLEYVVGKIDGDYQDMRILIEEIAEAAELYVEMERDA